MERVEDLKSIFEALRNDPTHHLGLGDIRLTIAQQDLILSDLTALLDKQREVILREELIKYEMWRNARCSDDEATCIINEYLKNVKKS